MTQDEIIQHMRKNTQWNQARALFSSECARLEQADGQRKKPTIFELREMEFLAVQKIAKLLGVTLP